MAAEPGPRHRKHRRRGEALLQPHPHQSLLAAGGCASTPETFLEGFGDGDGVQLAAAAGLTFDSTGGTDASTSHAVGGYMDVDDNADC